MKDINTSILELIETLGQEYKVLKYVYNNNSSFVPGVTPIYYSGPYWDNREIVEAIKTLLTGDWLSSGENVRKFETKFARKLNQKSAVMLNSGSSANLVMISALKKYLNWNDGDEIILSVVGFPTTLAPIIQNNLKPVFVDIEMESLNFDINKIRSKITQKTKAIFISPVLGNSPDLDRILQICSDFDLKVILDDCDSLGSEWNNKHLCEYAFCSSHSFYPSHHISTAEGGMVVSNDSEFIKLVRSFSWWGRDCFCVGAGNLIPHGSCGNRFDKWLDGYDGIIDHKYVFTNIGYNLKPLDMQGSIGLVQLEKLDEVIEKRINAKEVIGSLLEKYLDVKVPVELLKAKTSWFGVPIICKNKEDKTKLVTYLENKKIQTRNYFAGNILLHPGYKHLDDYTKYPEANKVLDQVFFIGCSPHYTNEIFEYIEKCLKEYK